MGTQPDHRENRDEQGEVGLFVADVKRLIKELFAEAGIELLYPYWLEYAEEYELGMSPERALQQGLVAETWRAAKQFIEKPDWSRSRQLRRKYFLSQDNLAAAVANRARVLRVENPRDSKHPYYPDGAARSFQVFELLLAIISRFTDKRTRRKWLDKPRGEIDWVKPYAVCNSDDRRDWKALLDMALADLEKSSY